MTGRVVVVTGAAGSIGKPMCEELARRGATVVMAGRAPRIEAAAAEVRSSTGSATVETLEMDLASFKSVRAGAAELLRRHPSIHVLVNNAAVFSRTRKATADGQELLFGTNHLGHFLLTNLLVDRLKASAPARVVLMTMGTKVPIPLDDMDFAQKYNGVDALIRSKAAVTCFAVELAHRLRGSGVTVNALNPELTRSTLPREAPLPLRLVFSLFGASPERAKDYGVRLACEESLRSVTGKFFRKEVEKEISALYTDPSVRQQLWAESARRVGLS